MERLVRATFELFTKKTTDSYFSGIEYFPYLDHEKAIEHSARPTVSTLSYNSALDLDVDFQKYIPKSDFAQKDSFVLSPSGKALNVAVGLKQWGINPVVFGVQGGSVGKIINCLLEHLEISSRNLIEVHEETRINLYGVHVGENDPVTISTKGKAVTKKDLVKLDSVVNNNLCKGDILAVSGSFPPGFSHGYWGGFLKRMKGKGVDVFVDIQDPIFIRQTFKNGAKLLGINVYEFVTALNLKPQEFEKNPKNVAAECSNLSQSCDIDIFLISMGEVGTVLYHDGISWYAEPPKYNVVSSVGAGDTLQVGMVYGKQRGLF